MSKVTQFCLQCLYCTLSFGKLLSKLETFPDVKIYCALVKSKLYLAFVSRFIICKHRRTVDRNAVKKRTEVRMQE